MESTRFHRVNNSPHGGDYYCNGIFEASPTEIRWIIANNYLKPIILLQRFMEIFPDSTLIDHVINGECKQCEEKIVVMMKDNGKYGTEILNVVF